MPLLPDRRGAIAVFTAIVLSILLGMAGLAIDAGHIYMQRATLQQVSDAAAIAGAFAYKNSASATAVTATVQDVVQANGWASTTIQSPATGYLAQSPQNAANAAVRVQLTANMSTYFIGLVKGASVVPISVTSVVELAEGQSAVCMLSLTTFTFSGTIDGGGCGIGANSSSKGAITVTGSITASLISTPGTIIANGSITGALQNGAAVASNPFAGDQAQLSTVLQTPCTNFGASLPAQPVVVFCQGVTESGTLTLPQGVFYFPSLTISGTITASQGTTIIVGGNLTVSGNISVTAPTSGTWNGMALYVGGSFTDSGSLNILSNGAIYVPNNSFTASGNILDPSSCAEIVAKSIVASGTFVLPRTSANCANYPTPMVTGGPTQIALRQ